jgi:hypothetical protein
MAILCPKCGHQYDVTLFEFGNVVKCDCGARIYIDLQKGVVLKEETIQQETNTAPVHPNSA